MIHKIRLNSQVNPIIKAGIFSRIFLTWISSLFALAQQRSLECSDIWSIPPSESCELLVKKLQKYWKAQTKKTNPNFLKAVFWTFKREIMTSGISLFFQNMILIIKPILIGSILFYLQDIKKSDIFLPIALNTSALILLSVVYVFLKNIYYWDTCLYGSRLRVAASSLIYQKMLNLNQKSLANTNCGHIITLLTADMGRLEQSFVYLHFFWIGILQIFVVLVFAILTNGIVSILSIPLILLAMILQGFLSHFYGKIKLRVAEATDERLKLLKDVIAGIRVIKMYTWENFFLKIIKNARRLMLIARLLQVFQISMVVYLPKISIWIVYLSLLYIWPSNDPSAFTSYKIFTIYGLLQSLYMNVILFVPLSVQHYFDTFVACSRIEKFLLIKTLQVQESLPFVKDIETTVVRVYCASASWQSKIVLSNITFFIEGNQLYGLIGSVGCGKTSLFQMILGELPYNNGIVCRSEKIAYLPQTPWVFPGTIRENVLAGLPFEKERYDVVLRDCRNFPAGDFTIVGERGTSLSGGQKARLALARVAYSRYEIVLLDSPLVAIDTRIAAQVFQKCICEFMSDRLRILVTHKRKFLEEMDGLLILKEKSIRQVTQSEYRTGNLDDDVSEIFGRLNEYEEIEPIENELLENEPQYATDNTNTTLSSLGHTPSTENYRSIKYNSFDWSRSISIKEDIVESSPSPESFINESKKEGVVTWKEYYDWATMGCGLCGFIMLLSLFVLTIAIQGTCDVWVAKWTTVADLKYKHDFPSNGNNSSSFTKNTLDDYNWFPNDNISFIVFTGLTASLTFISIIRTFLYFLVFLRASKKIHNNMLLSLMNSRIRFFETNDSGRILNRFSKDINQVDWQIQITFHDFLQSIMSVIQTCLITIITSYYVLLPMALLFFAFFYGRVYYLMVSRDLKRFDCLARSYILKHITVSLQGLPCIKTSKSSIKNSEVEFSQHIDIHNSIQYLIIASQRWIAVRLDAISVIFNIAVMLISLGLGIFSNIPSGELGLVLNISSGLIGMFQWTTRQSAEIENLMVSVERTLEYTHLETEESRLRRSNKDVKIINISKVLTQKLDENINEEDVPLLREHAPEDVTLENWHPDSGFIKFSKVCLRYDKRSNWALQNVSFQIFPTEKVGIVGRTGAGKSSLITAIFRLVELEHGFIEIDGVDLSTITLKTLRSAISIIPQDSIMFTGTLRMNLDPTDSFSDSQLWHALKSVQLYEVINSYPLGLNTLVGDEGSNFSIGQRQLISLARAILRGSKILIIDEGTANVDPLTDSVIQNTIRKEFTDCTVLTIAHRLNTIIDSDRIIVMDRGKILEIGEPFELLNPSRIPLNSDAIVTGALEHLVNQSGQLESRNLRDIAKRSYFKPEAIYKRERRL